MRPLADVEPVRIVPVRGAVSRLDAEDRGKYSRADERRGILAGVHLQGQRIASGVRATAANAFQLGQDCRVLALAGRLTAGQVARIRYGVPAANGFRSEFDRGYGR